jgi:hypothetical protein
MGVLGHKVETRMTRRRSGEGAGVAKSEDEERREDLPVQSTRPDTSSPGESVPDNGSLSGDRRKEASEQSPGPDSYPREDLADVEPELGNEGVKAPEQSSKPDPQTGKSAADFDRGPGEHLVGKRPKLMSRKEAAILGVRLSAAAGPVGLEERLEIEALAAETSRAARSALDGGGRKSGYRDRDEKGE